MHERPEVVPPASGQEKTKLKIEAATLAASLNFDPETFRDFVCVMIKLTGGTKDDPWKEDSGVVSPYILNHEKEMALRLSVWPVKDSRSVVTVHIVPEAAVVNPDSIREPYLREYLETDIDSAILNIGDMTVLRRKAFIEIPKNSSYPALSSYCTEDKILALRPGEAPRGYRTELSNAEAKTLAHTIFDAWISNQH